MRTSMCLKKKMNSGQLFSFVFNTLVLFLFTSPPCSSLQEYSDDGPAAAVSFSAINQDEKVDLFLYYESLCPGCAIFISEYLVNVFEKGLIDIVNLRLVPWGNAKLIQPNNTIICQHAENECYLKTIHACAINAWPDVIVKLQENLSAIKNLQLVLQYGNETKNLIPPHEYVPWVTVNKKAIGDDMLNYKKHVCDAYKGSHVPEACKKLQPPTKTNNTGDHHEKAMSSNSMSATNDEAINL